LHADEIIQKARDKAQRNLFDSESFREGLEIAVDAVLGKPTRSPESVAWHEAQFVDFLANRLKVADYIRQNPSVLIRPVTAPIIIIGLPRTGSTLLSYLLDADESLRSLLRWEMRHLVPPPTQGGLRNDPRCLALIEEERRAASNPLPHLHHEPWDGPTECHTILSHDFKSAGLGPGLASFGYGMWLLECDTGSAYDYHRTVLQMLQSQTTGTWSLKLPSHALNIRTLMAAYPDARIIWTHRDPYQVSASFMSMMAAAQSLHLREIDRDYIRRYYPLRLREHVSRPMAVQDASANDPFHHIFYGDLMRDPVGQMRKLYAWLGRPLTATTEEKMSLWLQNNRQGKFGKHAYSLEDLGFSERELTPFFEDYVARFGLARER
jgi:hypothetical protein